jgi:hypothetical protein
VRRVFEAFREWLELRRRLRDERRFHLERSVADLRALGVSAREAKRIARSRLGRRSHARSAIREIGGDFGGLLQLLRAYRVPQSIWLRPFALLAALAVMILVSPSRWLLVESIAWRPLHSEPSPMIYFSVPAPWPVSSGLTDREFDAVGSLPDIRGLERFRVVDGRAYAAPRANPATIEAEARAVSGNSRLSVKSDFDRKRLGMGPAVVTWVMASLWMLFSLRGLRRGGVRWLVYASSLGLLHILASLTIWGLALQLWSLMPSPAGLASGLTYAALLVGYMLSVALHCQGWRRDLSQRCPVCLECLFLPSTEGTTERMLLGTAVTESVCAHGHGTLIESRWDRRFVRGQWMLAD